MVQDQESFRKRGIWLLKSCIRRLCGLLSHGSPQIRAEVAIALGNIGDPESVKFLADALLREKQDEQLALALAQIGDQSVLPQLLEAFRESSNYSRPNIAIALGAFRTPQVLEALISNLSDPDPNVRFNCISTLGKMKEPSAVSHLLACLGEANEWIFLNVVSALSCLNDHRATNPMIAFYLKEQNERKRAAIITALGTLRDFTALPTLSKALRDPDDRVKANAIEAIFRLDLPKDKALNLLQPFLKHPHNRVRGNALLAASELSPDLLPPILEDMAEDPDKWIRATLGYILSIIEFPKAIELVLKLLKDNDADVRKNAARALAKKARDQETEILIRMLNDQTPFLRLKAANTLGRLKSVPAITSLSRLFARERNFKIRSAIISALGSIGNKAALKTLTQALNDLDSRVRANAIESLENILGDDASPLIRPLLKDPDNRTKANAAKALFNSGDTSVLEPLEQMLLDKEISTKISGIYALGQIGLSLRELEKSPMMSVLKSSLKSVEVPEGTPPDTSSQKSGEVGSKSEKEALRKTLIEFHQQGKFKEAIEAAKNFLIKFPHDLNANLFAANLNFQLSRFDEAITYFKRCIETDPLHLQSYANLAMACYRGGRIKESIHYFKEALKLKPDLANLRFNLANLLLKENSWEDAIFQYEEGMRYQNPTPRVLANIGFACQKTGQYEKAIKYYVDANIADPKEAGIYYNWALILARQGKREEAKIVLQRAIKAVPIGSAGLKTIKDLLERFQG